MPAKYESIARSIGAYSADAITCKQRGNMAGYDSNHAIRFAMLETVRTLVNPKIYELVRDQAYSYRNQILRSRGFDWSDQSQDWVKL